MLLKHSPRILLLGHQVSFRDLLSFFFKVNCGGVLHSASIFIKKRINSTEYTEILTKKRNREGEDGGMYKNSLLYKEEIQLLTRTFLSCLKIGIT